MTGQPDFAHIVIDYCRTEWLVESKSLKLFRIPSATTVLSREDCSIYIAKRLVELLGRNGSGSAPTDIPRGGIPIDVLLADRQAPEGVWLPDQGVTSPIAGAGELKKPPSWRAAFC